MIIAAQSIVYAEDAERTRAFIREFNGDITNAGFGLLISVRVPGGGELGLYQPRHELAISLPG